MTSYLPRCVWHGSVPVAGTNPCQSWRQSSSAALRSLHGHAPERSIVSADDLAAVLDGERRLADPSVRADRDQLLALLHPEFEEVGRSGRHWHRDAIIDALLEDPGDGYELLDLTAETARPGVILATYGARALDAEHAASRHSSIWLQDHGRWRMRYHQGTPVL